MAYNLPLNLEDSDRQGIQPECKKVGVFEITGKPKGKYIQDGIAYLGVEYKNRY